MERSSEEINQLLRRRFTPFSSPTRLEGDKIGQGLLQLWRQLTLGRWRSIRQSENLRGGEERHFLCLYVVEHPQNVGWPFDGKGAPRRDGVKGRGDTKDAFPQLPEESRQYKRASQFLQCLLCIP